MSALAQHKQNMGKGNANRLFLRSLGQWIFLLPVVSLVMVSAQGCSVYLAAHQPDPKDLTVLEQGTPHHNVTAELGSPIWSVDRNKDKVEIYKFKQGSSSKSVRLGRTLFHAIADVFTLGIWEIPATVIEKVGLSGTDMTAKVSYDAEGRVQTSELFDSNGSDREGTVGVVVRSTPPDVRLRIPAKGWLAYAGRGAAPSAVSGANIGVLPIVLCPLYFIPSCLAGMGGLVIGSVVGGIYGVVTAEPFLPVEQSEMVVQAALEDLNIQEALRDLVVQGGRELTSNSIILLTNQELASAEIQHSYPALHINGINTVVDLSEVTVELRVAGSAVNPDRNLAMSVRCRVIRTVDGAEIDSRLVTDESGRSRSVAEWADQNAHVFREEVTQAAQRVARHVVKGLFPDAHSENDVQTLASQALSH